MSYVLNREEQTSGGFLANSKNKLAAVPWRHAKVSERRVAVALDEGYDVAPIFHVFPEQILQLEAAQWDDYHPEWCRAPYPTFIIRPDSPVPIKVQARVPNSNQDRFLRDGGTVQITEFYVNAIYDPVWTIVEMSEMVFHGSRTYQASAISFNREEKTLRPIKPREQWVREPHDFPVCEKIYYPEIRKSIFVESSLTVRDIVGFVHLINHRDVRVQHRQYLEYTNRSERKQLERTGEIWYDASGTMMRRDHYEIRIPPYKQVERMTMQTIKDKHYHRQPCPHPVRRHVRTRFNGVDLAPEEFIQVRRHWRGLKSAEVEKFVPDYDARRLLYHKVDNATQSDVK